MVNVAKKLIGKSGTKLYSSICGVCYFNSVDFDRIGSEIKCIKVDGRTVIETYWFDKYGRLSDCVKKIPSDAECVLFFSQDERDWTQVWKESDEMKSIDQRANEYASEDMRHEYLHVRQEAYRKGAHDQLHIDLRRMHEWYNDWLKQAEHEIAQIPEKLATETKESFERLCEDHAKECPGEPKGIHWNDGYCAHDKLKDSMHYANKDSIKAFLNKLDEESAESVYPDAPMDSILTDLNKIQQFEGLPMTIFTRIGSQYVPPIRYCTPADILNFRCFPIPTFKEWKEIAQCMVANGDADPNIVDAAIYIKKMRDYRTTIRLNAKHYLIDKIVREQ